MGILSTNKERKVHLTTPILNFYPETEIGVRWICSKGVILSKYGIKGSFENKEFTQTLNIADSVLLSLFIRGRPNGKYTYNTSPLTLTQTETQTIDSGISLSFN